MPILEPADLPFRKLDAERHFDALAYCPMCRSTEVQIVRTYTAHVNLTAVTGAEVSEQLEYFPASFKVFKHMCPSCGSRNGHA